MARSIAGRSTRIELYTVYSSNEVVYSGHGAGRSRSTTKTAALSTFGDIVDFFKEHDVVGNIAPGVLGDNPSSAYKPLEAVIAALPIESACTLTYLRTRVSYKEGLSFKGPDTQRCAEFIEANWDVENESILQYDLKAYARFLPRLQEMVEEQNKLWQRVQVHLFGEFETESKGELACRQFLNKYFNKPFIKVF